VSDSDVCAPDAIEPLVLWRTWNYHGGRLLSHNGTPWEPGEAMEACCPVHEHDDASKWDRMAADLTRRWPVAGRERINLSDGELQDQLRSLLSEALRHAPPEADCTCGIYALDDLAACPPGVVAGTVSLWGKVVRGSAGARARYGYPAALYVPDRLLDDDGLATYRVPLRALDGPGGPYSEGGAAAGIGEPRRPILPSLRSRAGIMLAA
jgi:hypothetical protein